jgi:Nucleotidyl transferase AbiEii toxin, Type IV TA system
VAAVPQIEQGYFLHLDFVPAAIPSLALEEVIAEKIRAASQRSKIRDLYDLSEIARRPLQRNLIRPLAVLKLWHSTGPGLDFECFRAGIEGGRDYDVLELRNLLRRDESPDLAGMIDRVVKNFQFLGQMTEAERVLAADLPRRLRDQAGALRIATAAI